MLRGFGLQQRAAAQRRRGRPRARVDGSAAASRAEGGAADTGGGDRPGSAHGATPWGAHRRAGATPSHTLEWTASRRAGWPARVASRGKPPSVRRSSGLEGPWPPSGSATTSGPSGLTVAVWRCCSGAHRAGRAGSAGAPSAHRTAAESGRHPETTARRPPQHGQHGPGPMSASSSTSSSSAWACNKGVTPFDLPRDGKRIIYPFT